MLSGLSVNSHLAGGATRSSGGAQILTPNVQQPETPSVLGRRVSAATFVAGGLVENHPTRVRTEMGTVPCTSVAVTLETLAELGQRASAPFLRVGRRRERAADRT